MSQFDAMTTEQLIGHYISLRAHKEEADKEFKKSMERVNVAMEKIESKLLEKLDGDGETSKTVKGVGTCYIRTATNMSTKDRDAFMKWCLQNRNLDAMDIRPNKTIIKEVIAEGKVVPGVEVTTTRLIGVRKG